LRRLGGRRLRGIAMPKVCLVIAAWSAANIILGHAVAVAQSFPIKPVRIITYPAGGGTDFTARLIAQELTTAFRQSVIVENRPGGVLQGELLANASPDGYTVLLNGNALWLAPLMQKARYDPLEFAPITLAATSPNVLVVHPSVAAGSVSELIALAKARPGQLNYASGPAGVPNHLAGELFKALAGVNIVRIGYKGGGPALNDLLAGQVHVLFASAGGIMPHAKAGRLRALAVTSAKRSPLFPDLPTIAESGLPDYEIVSNDAVFAPPNTPRAVVQRLSSEISHVLTAPDVREKFFSAGVEAVGSSPEMLRETVGRDMARFGKVIRDAGIRTE